MFQNAMAKALKTEWPEYKVYTGDVKQYLDTPCFVIKQVELDRQLELGGNRAEHYSYAVYYYSKKDAQQEDIDRMGVDILRALELIWHEGLGYWASSMQCRMVENTLLLTLSYTCRYRMVEEVEPMETLQHTILIGDGKHGK